MKHLGTPFAAISFYKVAKESPPNHPRQVMEFTGDIVLKYTLGGEEYLSTFEQLDSSVNRSLELGVVHGIAIACGVLLMVLAWVIIIKKKNPIFVLNQLTLLLMVIKSSLYLAFLFGPLSSLTYKFTDRKSVV